MEYTCSSIIEATCSTNSILGSNPGMSKWVDCINEQSNHLFMLEFEARPYYLSNSRSANLLSYARAHDPSDSWKVPVDTVELWNLTPTPTSLANSTTLDKNHFFVKFATPEFWLGLKYIKKKIALRENVATRVPLSKFCNVLMFTLHLVQIRCLLVIAEWKPSSQWKIDAVHTSAMKI